MLRARCRFWGATLVMGARSAAWIWGIAGGFGVGFAAVGRFLLHFSWGTSAAILAGVVLAVFAEGAYRKWHEADARANAVPPVKVALVEAQNNQGEINISDSQAQVFYDPTTGQKLARGYIGKMSILPPGGIPPATPGEVDPHADLRAFLERQRQEQTPPGGTLPPGEDQA